MPVAALDELEGLPRLRLYFPGSSCFARVAGVNAARGNCTRASEATLACRKKCLPESSVQESVAAYVALDFLSLLDFRLLSVQSLPDN